MEGSGKRASCGAGAGTEVGEVPADGAGDDPEATARCRVNPPVPGLPADGEPLSDEEERILGRVEMDAMIGVPEVVYEDEAA